MEKIIVGIAEGKIAFDTQILVSFALGSCVGICLYDAKKKIAGMAHIILPCSRDSLHQENPYKFADAGVKLLVRDMVRSGAEPSRIVAKIAGGAQMFETHDKTWEIGELNTNMVRHVLRKERISIVAEDMGKNYGRTILFYAKDGKLEINTMRRMPIVL